MKLKILDLFSGLGGFSLGLERTGNFETIAFCDNDKYSNLVLQKHWKGVKIYNDVKEITKEKLIADGIQLPDIITGGFPCQPFSVAGKQKGTSDDRHLWPEMFRIIQELKPRWVIGENVKGLVNLQDGMVFETVCTDLEGEGYEVRAFNIPAAGVGAPHRRERIWIIASLVNANSDGSSATTIGGSVEKTSNDDQEREIKTRESERTSGRKRNEDMEDSNNNGHEGGLTETRNQVSSRQESKINGSTNTNISSRRSDGRGDNEQSRVDGEVQRLRDGDEKESTRATGIRGLHERTDISQGVAREDRNQEDDSRTLVQEGQSRIQSSIDRRLEQDQTASEDNQIRQRDDGTSLNRMERRDEDVEDSRRTLQSRTELREKNEDEVGEGYANQHQRSGSTSESNVANANSDRSTERGERQTIEKESYGGRDIERGSKINGRQRCVRETRQSKGNDVANTESSDRNDNDAVTRDGRSSTQEVFGNGSSVSGEGSWWHTEPDVGRVAHGIPGRVYRLKGLGNSIVPKIAEEIGKAIIKAEREE
jgi:DNA (cytosine-5)-methyltransferase 1